ncbi:hypothetical protein D3C80_1028590 [compost metagenome]
MALGELEVLQRLGALEHLVIARRLLGHLAAGQPGAQAVAGGLAVLPRRLQLEAALLQGVQGVLGLVALALDLLLDALARFAVEEVLHAEALLDQRQVLHHGAAEVDQEAGEDHGHRPQGEAEELLGAALGLVHDGSILSRWTGPQHSAARPAG